MSEIRRPAAYANLYAADYLPAGLTRRSFLERLATSAMAAAIAGAAASSARAAGPADDVVRMGYIPITDATALLVAHAKGFFADAGLESEEPTLMRGWAPLVEAFAAGRLNLAHFLMPIPVWMRYNTGFPVKVVGLAHTNGSGLVVGRHTDIASFADLGAKQVAVPFWYSMHNVVLQYAFRQSGIVPVIKAEGEPLAPNECNLQVMPPPDMPPALAAAKIDAYIVAEPFNALGELRAGARMLRFTGDIWKNHPCCVLAMHEEATARRPEWTQAVVDAVVRGAVYASENKAEVAHLLSRDGRGYLPVPADVVARAMLAYDEPDYLESGAIKHPEWNSGRIDFDPWPYPSATKLMVETLRETVVGGDARFLQDLDAEFVARDLVEYGYVRAAIEKHAPRLASAERGADPFARVEVLAL